MAELLIKHVFGNVMRVAIPLTMRIRKLENGKKSEHEEDFYPNTDMPIQVVLKREGTYKKSYTPTVEGNLVTFEDDGTLSTGSYDVTVLCYDQDANPCRYMVKSKIKVVSATKEAGIVAGVEFDSLDYVLDGAVYFYAKGDDGLSAYEIAVLHGYQGTEEEWIESVGFNENTTYILTGGKAPIPLEEEENL